MFKIKKWVSIDNSDIAIAELSNEVVFSQKASPICLPTRGKMYNDVSAIASGWGRAKISGEIIKPEILRKVFLSTYLLSSLISIG